MEYRIINTTDSPILAEALGFHVPAHGASRVLSMEERNRAWSVGLPEGLKLQPLLLEVPSAKPEPVIIESDAGKASKNEDASGQAGFSFEPTGRRTRKLSQKGEAE